MGGLRETAGSVREESMDEFNGGFLRSPMVGFALALLASFAYVWFG